jgi:hypothetical protein
MSAERVASSAHERDRMPSQKWCDGGSFEIPRQLAVSLVAQTRPAKNPYRAKMTLAFANDAWVLPCSQFIRPDLGSSFSVITRFHHPFTLDVTPA